MVKENGKHRVATGARPSRKPSKKLTSLSGSEIAVIASARMTNEELLMVKRLVKQLGAGHVEIVPRHGEADGYLISADRNPNTNGVKLVLGLEKPGSGLDRVKSGIEQGRIKALLCLQENLVEDAGFSPELLGKLDFLLATHPLANPTTGIADVVLPGACWAEKIGHDDQRHWPSQRLNKAVDAPGQTLESWEIVRDLIQALGGGNGIYSATDLFKQLAAEVPAFKGLSWGQIGDLGLPLIETGETIPAIEREKQRKAAGLIVG